MWKAMHAAVGRACPALPNFQLDRCFPVSMRPKPSERIGMHTEGLCLRVTHAMEVTAAKTQWEMLQSTAAKQKPSFQRLQDAGIPGFPVGPAGFEPATPWPLAV